MKRYKASTEWHVPPPWDWSLLEDIERFLLERLASDNGTQRELTTRDGHGDVAAATIAEARERIEHEATELQELSLIVWTGPEQAFEGKSEMAATLRVRRSATSANVSLDFSGLEDTVARRLKVDFDAWRDRRALLYGLPKVSHSIGDAAGRAAEASPTARAPWWKPDLHSVRDNLVANVLWVLLLAMIGVALAWWGLR